MSRLIHVSVWVYSLEYEYLTDEVLPLLKMVAQGLEAVRRTGDHDEVTKKALLVIRRNVEARIRNLETNFLAGKASNFIPEDKLGKLATGVQVVMGAIRRRKSQAMKMPGRDEAAIRRLGRSRLGIVYDYSKMDWHNPSIPVLRDVSINQMGENPQVAIVLMTATEMELLQVLRSMSSLPRRRTILKIPDGYETYYLGRFGQFTTAVVRCAMGSEGPNAASHTARSALERWKPSALILVGIAFGRSAEEHLPGDVLIAEQVVPYEKQRVGEPASFRAPVPPTGLTLINRFTNALGWTFARPDGSVVSRHYGCLLSGEKLIDDPDYKQELMDEFTEAIGGEMEAAGACAAAIRGRVEWIAVKGVADWADGKKHDGYQEMAAAAAVSLVHHVFSSKYALDGLT